MGLTNIRQILNPPQATTDVSTATVNPGSGQPIQEIPASAKIPIPQLPKQLPTPQQLALITSLDYDFQFAELAQNSQLLPTIGEQGGGGFRLYPVGQLTQKSIYLAHYVAWGAKAWYKGYVGLFRNSTLVAKVPFGATQSTQNLGPLTPGAVPSKLNSVFSGQFNTYDQGPLQSADQLFVLFAYQNVNVTFAENWDILTPFKIDSDCDECRVYITDFFNVAAFQFFFAAESRRRFQSASL